MIAEKVAVLYRGGAESDARLHLAVGSPPSAPACAGSDPREVVSVAYPYAITLLEPWTDSLVAAVNELAEQMAVRVLSQAVTQVQRDRLCGRCATDLTT